MTSDDMRKLDVAHMSFLAGVKPVFYPCAACGETMLMARDSRCAECQRADELHRRVTETQRRTLLTIPESYRWATFDDAALLSSRVKAKADVMQRARDLATTAGRAPKRLTIVGAHGSGKTSLGCAALRAWTIVERHGLVPMFVHAYKLGVARIQHAAGDGEPRLVDEAMRAPLVLIDDVGNERPTQTNAVPDVIIERHAEGLPTIVTTGLSPSEIGARYGGGVERRLFEGAAVARLEGAIRAAGA